LQCKAGSACGDGSIGYGIVRGSSLVLGEVDSKKGDGHSASVGESQPRAFDRGDLRWIVGHGEGSFVAVVLVCCIKYSGKFHPRKHASKAGRLHVVAFLAISYNGIGFLFEVNLRTVVDRTAVARDGYTPRHRE
jgi:hypothetical protein